MKLIYNETWVSSKCIRFSPIVVIKSFCSIAPPPFLGISDSVFQSMGPGNQPIGSQCRRLSIDPHVLRHVTQPHAVASSHHWWWLAATYPYKPTLSRLHLRQLCCSSLCSSSTQQQVVSEACPPFPHWKSHQLHEVLGNLSTGWSSGLPSSICLEWGLSHIFPHRAHVGGLLADLFPSPLWKQWSLEGRGAGRKAAEIKPPWLPDTRLSFMYKVSVS